MGSTVLPPCAGSSSSGAGSRPGPAACAAAAVAACASSARSGTNGIGLIMTPGGLAVRNDERCSQANGLAGALHRRVPAAAGRVDRRIGEDLGDRAGLQVSEITTCIADLAPALYCM